MGGLQAYTPVTPITPPLKGVTKGRGGYIWGEGVIGAMGLSTIIIMCLNTL